VVVEAEVIPPVVVVDAAAAVVAVVVAAGGNSDGGILCGELSVCASNKLRWKYLMRMNGGTRLSNGKQEENKRC
jgi:hypothetical protein